MGFSGWIPQTAPTSGDSHFGVDRSSDTVRLAGNRLSGSGKRLDEALFELAVEIADVGDGSPDCCFMNFTNYRKLLNILGAKVERMQKTTAYYSFEGAKIIGPNGTIEVYPDRNCPPDKAYLIQKDTWVFLSLGQAPQVLNLDGKQFLREGSADAYEVRIACFGNLACFYPGANGVLHSL